jgi:hypothetical protein
MTALVSPLRAAALGASWAGAAGRAGMGDK